MPLMCPPNSPRGPVRSSPGNEQPPPAAGAPVPGPPPPPAAGLLTPVARTVYELSRAGGAERPVELVGRDPALETLLLKVAKFARFNEPILITGESGVGKELVARACHLLSWRRDNPFLSVNCPQFHDSNTTVSELFGHRRGSFTGAVNDRAGLFEAVGRGVIFLDEIGDLPLTSQVLLLRALAEGEFKPLGATQAQTFYGRVVAATNQPLEEMMRTKEFRNDLFFRLRYFRLDVPPLRARGDDWRLLLERVLDRLNAAHGACKRFSADALRLLAGYPWPGNVRELQGIVTMGYSLSETNEIGVADIVDELDPCPRGAAAGPPPPSEPSDEHVPLDAGFLAVYHHLLAGRMTFWEDVHAPFMGRELNRVQVKSLIEHGLRESRGSYRQLCARLHVPAQDYQKFMDFLRHHRLKPEA